MKGSFFSFLCIPYCIVIVYILIGLIPVLLLCYAVSITGGWVPLFELSKEERVEDVTFQYVDMESHKSALLVEQERLLELMSQAESIDDIITIESRLSDVRYQLESMESQLRTYDNLIDYATISISISEVVRFTPQPTQTTWEKIKEGFSNNLFNIKKGIKNFCIGFIIAIPYLILWAIIIVLMFFLIRFLIKWNDKRNTRKKEIKERRSHQTDEKVKNE